MAGILGHISSNGSSTNWGPASGTKALSWPLRRGCNFTIVFYELISKTTSCEIGLRTPQKPTEDKSTLVQVMACAMRHQAITWANIDPDLCRHHYGITRPQWVNSNINTARPEQNGWNPADIFNSSFSTKKYFWFKSYCWSTIDESALIQTDTK